MIMIPFLHDPRFALIRFLLRHFLAGCGGAVAFLAALLLTDYAGIASMLEASPNGLLFAFLLLSGLCATFGSVAMGVGIMRDRP